MKRVTPSLHPQQQQPQPQWGPVETRELIRIRGELESEDAAVGGKSKKAVWEVVSRRMRERGHFRTSEQCKCKWKNLLHRYKGKETSDPESGLPCPFFEELHLVFSERTKAMQQKLVEPEAGARIMLKSMGGEGYSAEFSEGDHEIEDDTTEGKLVRSNAKKRKGQGTSMKPKSTRIASGNDVGGIHDLLKELLQHQQSMEMEWMQRMERRARDRELFDQEWRQLLEKLERERLTMEQAWREREEQRRIREESRAEMRDALLTTLFNQLIHENDRHVK